ncbi:MAG TPA: winged helix-turn-helix domain-containing protein [Polyangiaceae bacterium]
MACTNGIESTHGGFDSEPAPAARRLDVRDVRSAVHSGVHAVQAGFDAGSEATPSPTGTLSVNYDEKVIRINGDSVRLTRTEFKLLAHLVERPFGWVTAAELIRDVLGTHHRPDTPLVRVHVHAVRRKLGEHATWLESDPHRLRGYRWVGPSQN